MIVTAKNTLLHSIQVNNNNARFLWLNKAVKYSINATFLDRGIFDAGMLYCIYMGVSRGILSFDATHMVGFGQWAQSLWVFFRKRFYFLHGALDSMCEISLSFINTIGN